MTQSLALALVKQKRYLINLAKLI